MLETISPWLIGAALGGAAMLFVGKKFLMKIARPSVKELVKTQIVDDEFDGSSLLKWAQQHRIDGDIKILVVKPTPFWVKKLNLKDAESIDAQRNLIGCMVDTKSEKLLAIQLFSFGKMSDTMIGKFGDSDRFILTT